MEMHGKDLCKGGQSTEACPKVSPKRRSGHDSAVVLYAQLWHIRIVDKKLPPLTVKPLRGVGPSKDELMDFPKPVIKARGLTQARAARILGLDQPKISAITSGRLDGFSTDRLMRFLNELGCDVEISVSQPHPDTRGSVSIT